MRMTNARFTQKFRNFFSPSPLPTNKQMSPSPQIKAHSYVSCYLCTRIKSHIVCACNSSM